MGTVLSSLLPGLREVRAPLVGGYLWLGALWLALGPHLPPRNEATGVVEDVLELAGRVPPVVLFLVLSVVAYLVGTLVEDWVRSIRRWRRGRYDYTGVYGKRPRANASPQSDTSLQLLVSERVREAPCPLRNRAPRESGLSAPRRQAR
jgi:hypothetical protein